MLKFTYKGRFLTKKRHIKNSWIENPKNEHIFQCFFYTQKFLFSKNTKISIFGGILKFLKLIVFGQIFANFGSFLQFWADPAAFTVADSMPQLGLKSLKPHDFGTMSPNVMCSVSLKNYHPYLQLQQVSKNPKIYCIYNSLSKVPKFHIWNSWAFRD